MREVFFIADHNGAFLNAAGAFSVFDIAKPFYSYGEAQAGISDLKTGYYQIQKFFAHIQS